MKAYEDAVKKAQESYSRFFRNVKELPSADEFGDDVVLNVTKIRNVIAQAEGHMNNLNALKKEIEDKAESSMEPYFPKAHEQINTMTRSYEEAIAELKAKLSQLKK